MSFMRIGIDCRTILNPGFGEQAGVGHYTFFLIQHLLKFDQETEYVLFFDEQISKEAIAELISNRPNVTVRRFPFYGYRHMLPFIYAHVLVSGFITRERLDLFHAPSGQLPFTYRGRSVITIHDLAIFDHPEWFPQSILKRFLSTRIFVPHSVKRANTIIVPSESTARDVRRLFPGSDRKIVVVPHGVLTPPSIDIESAEELRVRYHLSERYLLFVGTLEPRKNIATLIRAFRTMHASDKFRDLSLVIAGSKGWKYDEIFVEIEKTKQQFAPNAPVKYVGYVSAKEKFTLMKHAIAFIYPSRYEGFGLPVLEAMSVGTPIIAGNTSSLPEVVGDAGLFVNPENEDELAGVMRKILNNEALQATLSQKGQARAKEFTWMKTAERLWKLYRETVEKS